MTLVVVLSSADGGTTRRLRQEVSRSRTRVHLSRSDNTEWLFVQNPVDPRRVSGVLIRHADKVVIAYEESDLRNWMGIRGWADIIRMAQDTPRRYTGISGGIGIEVRVERARPGVDASRLLDPTLKFPTYRSTDLAGWLER